MDQQNGLASALVDAQRRARAVGKNAENTWHKYRYASAEAIIDEARGALSESGLALLCDGWQFTAIEPAGEKSPVGRVTVRYTLLHTSGQARSIEASSFVIPEKGRPVDKAEAGAITTNLAYVLRGLLLLPRDDDAAAMDRRDDRAYEPRRDEPTSVPDEARFVAAIREATTLDELAKVPPQVDAAGLPPASRERIKSAYAARKAALLEAAPSGSASQLADEYVAQIKRESSLEALGAIVPRVQGLNLPEADLARVKAAYAARKAELAGTQKAAARAA